MSRWSGLVDAAVVGAGRGNAPEAAPLLAALTASARDDSTRLLHAAAAESRARRAGYLPADASQDAAPEPSELDSRRSVGALAARRLRELLAAERADLLLEWLMLLARTGRRPPDAQVPALLTAATASREFRDALVPVLGPLAGWLAEANPEWAWVAATGPAGRPDTAIWRTGSHRERRELLGSLRGTDPATARALVLSTWPGDSARDRAAFVAAMATGLGPDDESLLDQALADRRGEVRHAAASLLAKLPDSKFSLRAVSRAMAALVVQRGITGTRLVVSVPGEATAEMIADCIDPDPPRATGRRAWMLRQIVAAAPAAWWPQHTGMSPRELLVLAARPEWRTALELGWTDAAIRDGDPAWIKALLRRADHDADRDVFQALNPADRDSWLVGHPDSPLIGWLDLVPAPWSAALSEVVRARIAVIAGTDPRQAPEPRKLLRLAAARLEPPSPPQVDPEQIHPRLQDTWTDLLTTLSIRAAMRRELAEEPTP
jgi:hypothetical protein